MPMTGTPTLDERRRAAGLSIAGLARRARVPYRRTWAATAGGAPLADDEIARIEAALAAAAGAPTDDRPTTGSPATAGVA